MRREKNRKKKTHVFSRSIETTVIFFRSVRAHDVRNAANNYFIHFLFFRTPQTTVFDFSDRFSCREYSYKLQCVHFEIVEVHEKKKKYEQTERVFARSPKNVPTRSVPNEIFRAAAYEFLAPGNYPFSRTSRTPTPRLYTAVKVKGDGVSFLI